MAVQNWGIPGVKYWFPQYPIPRTKPHAGIAHPTNSPTHRGRRVTQASQPVTFLLKPEFWEQPLHLSWRSTGSASGVLAASLLFPPRLGASPGGKLSCFVVARGAS